MSDIKKYEVLEKAGRFGLTVGSKVLKPGAVFTERQWPYGEKSLEAAIKNERCKLSAGSKKGLFKKGDGR